MRPLLIDNKLKERIAEVMAYAQANPLSPMDPDVKHTPPGDDDRYVVNAEVGFRIVYSVEITPFGNKARHISISVDTPNKLPGFDAAQKIIELFGFTTVVNPISAKDLVMGKWIEEISPRKQAINIFEIITD